VVPRSHRHHAGVGRLSDAVPETLTAGAAVLAATMLGAAIVDAVVLGSPLLIIPLMLLFLVATVWVMSQ
jgi:hypothetical protein